MRVADHGVGAHADQAVDKVQARLEHLFEEQHIAFDLRGQRDHAAHLVGGELRPGAVADHRHRAVVVAQHAALLLLRQIDVVLVQLDLDAQGGEHAPAHPVGVQVRALDLDLTAGGCRQRQVGGRFDVVVADLVRRAVQRGHAVDVELVGADAGDLGAHGVEHIGQILHMRLTGGIADDGVAFADDGGHQDVFGAGDGRFVKEQVGALQATGHGEVVAVVQLDAGAQLLQAVEMRVQAAAADYVAAGRVQLGLADAVQHGCHAQDGGAHLVAQLTADHMGVDAGHVHADALAAALDLAAQGDDDVQHVAHIDDVGHVVQHHLLVGQQAGRDHRQDGVLVAGGTHRAA